MKFWCSTAFLDTRHLLAVARALDVAGYHGALVADHLLYPQVLRSKYPYSTHEDGRPMWDPQTPWPECWVTIAAMAAVTERLEFSTNIYVAPLRPLLTVAKEVATASALSGGRVTLGAGAGWMEEEFELQGQDFASRGKRLGEMAEALRALWQPGWVEFHGTYYDVPRLVLAPSPPAPVPIWLGGESPAAMRRAAEIGDGWLGTAYGWDRAVAEVGKIQRLRAESSRADEPFEILCALYEMPTVDLFRRAEEIGITGVVCLPWVGRQLRGEPLTPEGLSDDIRRFAEDVVHRCQ